MKKIYIIKLAAEQVKDDREKDRTSKLKKILAYLSRQPDIDTIRENAATQHLLAHTNSHMLHNLHMAQTEHNNMLNHLLIHNTFQGF